MFNFFEELKKQFDLPSDIMSSFMMINLSNKFLYVEGHKGILKFSTDIISFKVKKGVITVTGQEMSLKELSHNTLCIKGNIKIVEAF